MFVDTLPPWIVNREIHGLLPLPIDDKGCLIIYQLLKNMKPSIRTNIEYFLISSANHLVGLSDKLTSMPFFAKLSWFDNFNNSPAW